MTVLASGALRLADDGDPPGWAGSLAWQLAARSLILHFVHGQDAARQRWDIEGQRLGFA